MNSNSSRTHAICELKMYRIVDGNMYTNSLKFVDLAGSERMAKSIGNTNKVGDANLEAIINNFSLMTLSKVC